MWPLSDFWFSKRNERMLFKFVITCYSSNMKLIQWQDGTFHPSILDLVKIKLVSSSSHLRKLFQTYTASHQPHHFTVSLLFSLQRKTKMGSLWAAFPSADAESSPIWWWWSLIFVVNLTQSAINEEICLGKNLWGYVQKGLTDGERLFQSGSTYQWVAQGKGSFAACLPAFASC